jgi:hypothetical protein
MIQGGLVQRNAPVSIRQSMVKGPTGGRPSDTGAAVQAATSQSIAFATHAPAVESN